MPELTDLSTGGIFLILVLRMVLDFLGKRENKSKEVQGPSRDCRECIRGVEDTLNRGYRLIEDLHKWHNVNNPDVPGQMIWWNDPKEMARARQSLCDQLHQINEKLDRRH